MNKDVLGIINLGEKENYIQELTTVRPLAAIPFAGRYRIIDFMLSNMINSKIDDIGIVLKDKFASLNDHIGPGKSWDLDRRKGGLRMLYPSVRYGEFTVSYGDLEILKQNINYFEHNKKSHILYTRSNYIGNISFEKAIEDHITNGRDITFLTRPIENGRNRMDLLGLDTLTKVGEDAVSIGKNLGTQNDYEISVEMYLMKKEVFLQIIKEAIEEGKYAYFKVALMDKLANYTVDHFHLTDELSPITSTQSYFNASMRLLDPEFAKYIFFKHGKIVTKPKDAPSTIYRPSSNVSNSLIANGCNIEGTVENSIIFRNVEIGKGTVIRNSIIFQNTVIGKNCTINYCIFDKDVNLGASKHLIGDGGLPYVVRKGVKIQ